jgi:hypothetical protein
MQSVGLFQKKFQVQCEIKLDDPSLSFGLGNVILV